MKIDWRDEAANFFLCLMASMVAGSILMRVAVLVLSP